MGLAGRTSGKMGIKLRKKLDDEEKVVLEFKASLIAAKQA